MPGKGSLAPSGKERRRVLHERRPGGRGARPMVRNGAKALGLAAGQTLSTKEDKGAYYAVYQQIYPGYRREAGRPPQERVLD